ncbi:MAG TPA: Sua5/YciO/YrdC/YwlC family protein, partial [Myxococcota bacterium]|nr:Sua5/YciO/YrdC/YwlC family protein [Myxococcota bacterium]
PLSARAAQHLDEALLAVEHHLGHKRPHGLRLTVTGIVQGIGFRPFVARTARALGLTGSVKNGPDGVVIELWGPPPQLERFIHTLQHAHPTGATIRSFTRAPLFGIAPVHFEIAETTPGTARLSIPPDLALCPECRAEIASSADRHHDHPFTSCTACGPRLSVTTALPYDRAHTTMAHFPMCPECATEYATESDRRYHAQSIACPHCGPTLSLLTPSRAPFAGDPRDLAAPLDQTATLLKDGKIIAIQALGGFHLACDATSTEATQRLRERKHRDAKPFAVMVRDLECAESLAPLSAEARALLTSSVGPIVLLDRHPDTALAPEVCGDTARIGLFL